MTIHAAVGIVVCTVHCPTCHNDGTVTYYDPLHARFVQRARVVPIHALTAMIASEEDRVREHLRLHANHRIQRLLATLRRAVPRMTIRRAR